MKIRKRRYSFINCVNDDRISAWTLSLQLIDSALSCVKSESIGIRYAATHIMIDWKSGQNEGVKT